MKKLLLTIFLSTAATYAADLRLYVFDCGKLHYDDPTRFKAVGSRFLGERLNEVEVVSAHRTPDAMAELRALHVDDELSVKVIRKRGGTGGKHVTSCDVHVTLLLVHPKAQATTS